MRSNEPIPSLGQFVEWKKVGDIYDLLLPAITNLFDIPEDIDPISSDGLGVAIGLKTAVHATYEGLGDGANNNLRIEALGHGEHPNGPPFCFYITSGTGKSGDYIELNGQVRGSAVQAIGKMVGSELLQTEIPAWQAWVRSADSSSPYIHAQFRPWGGRGRLGEIGLEGQGRSAEPEVKAKVRAWGRNPDVPYEPLEIVDEDIVKATLALYGAVTLWIAKPDPDALVTRTWTSPE